MILLVTGGSASGKSEYAENRALQMAKEGKRPLIYLAAMMPFVKDAEKRIERHRQLRAGKGFETVERYTAVEALCRGDGPDSEAFRNQAKGAVVMLECMSNLTANEMFSGSGNSGDNTGTYSRGQADRAQNEEEQHPTIDIRKVQDRIMKGIDALAEMAEHLVIVSINVFDEGVQQYDPWTGAYIQCLGELNQMLTERADEAVEVIYSIPVAYKEDVRCSH